MQETTHIQPTCSPDVRKSPSRLTRILTSSGIAGTLLMGGLFGVQGSMLTAHAQSLNSTVAFNTQSAQAKLSSSQARNRAYYVSVAREAAQKYHLDANIFVRQIQQESGFNPNAVSPAGAIGIAQFMPATARSMGVNPRNPVQALYGAARLMGNLKAEFGGSTAKALAAYNAGSGAVHYAVRHGGSNWLAWVPAETRHYVKVIMGWR